MLGLILLGFVLQIVTLAYILIDTARGYSGPEWAVTLVIYIQALAAILYLIGVVTL